MNRKKAAKPGRAKGSRRSSSASVRKSGKKAKTDQPLLTAKTTALLPTKVVSESVSLQALMTRLAQRFGSRKRLAKAVGVSLTALSRGIKQETYNVMTCLKIASATGESPGLILRCAGKTRVADLLDRLYGNGAGSRMEDDEALLEHFGSLSEDAQSAFMAVVRMVADAGRGRPARRRRSQGVAI